MKRAWLLCFGLCLPGNQAAAADPQPLNVLLIISDDLRDTVGCYGNSAVKTPHIDRLAGRGVRFERAYAQYPVCNPSRTSFLTGLRPEQTGVVANTTLFRTELPEVVTLPQLLKEHGWYAAAFGKIFHLHGGNTAEQARWMDLGNSWDEAAAFQPAPAGRQGEIRDLTAGALAWCRTGRMEGSDDDQPDGQNAAHVIRAIERQTEAGKPWIIGAGFHRPHDPFLVPKRYFDLYPAGSLKLYRDPAGITSVPPLSMPGGGFAKAFAAFSDADRMEFLTAYYAGVSFMDAQVGRVLATLDRLQLWDRTVVIFAGDNGYHHNQRGWWNKNTLFERSCRVPLVIAAPGARGGQVCHGLAELVDLYPTVADYSGLAAPHELAGQSLRPLLEDPSRPGKAAAFTLVTRGAGQFGQSVRTQRWRYTRWSDGTAELYDHQVDPEETRDVAADPAHGDVIRELGSLLKTLPAMR